MRPIFFALLLTFTALAAPAPVAHAFGVGLQPTTVEMEIEPGEGKRQVIHLANVHTEKTISLTIGLADWSLDESGQIVLSAPGETPKSGSEWVRFSPAFVTLEPGTSEQIVVDMLAPVRLPGTGDFRFALLASTILPEERGAGSGVWKRYQVASLFYLTVGDADSTPEITSSGISVDETGEPFLGLRIENSGNAHARLNGLVTVETTGGEVAEHPIANLVVLDGAARNTRVPLGLNVETISKVSVQLENTFAPQSPDRTEWLDTHEVDLQQRRAELLPATGAEVESSLP